MGNKQSLAYNLNQFSYFLTVPGNLILTETDWKNKEISQNTSDFPIDHFDKDFFINTSSLNPLTPRCD